MMKRFSKLLMVVKKLGISGFLIIRRNQKFKKITEFK
jgi:hypothetical protein